MLKYTATVGILTRLIVECSQCPCRNVYSFNLFNILASLYAIGANILNGTCTNLAGNER